MDLRIRLELLAAEAFDDSCRPSVRGRQDHIRRCLVFLLALAEPDEWSDVYRLVQRG